MTAALSRCRWYGAGTDTALQLNYVALKGSTYHQTGGVRIYPCCACGIDLRCFSEIFTHSTKPQPRSGYTLRRTDFISRMLPKLKGRSRREATEDQKRKKKETRHYSEVTFNKLS